MPILDCILLVGLGCGGGGWVAGDGGGGGGGVDGGYSYPEVNSFKYPIHVVLLFCVHISSAYGEKFE